MKPGLPQRRLLSAWLPVVIWMGILFTASTELGAPRQTSRFLVPFLRWLVPDITRGTLDTVQFVIRKTGHALGYAILAGLVWRARGAGEGEPAGRWCRQRAGLAWTLAVLYAATDEWHQTFTASRQGSVSDVALDSCGAALGLSAIWLWGRWCQRW